MSTLARSHRRSITNTLPIRHRSRGCSDRKAGEKGLREIPFDQCFKLSAETTDPCGFLIFWPADGHCEKSNGSRTFFQSGHPPCCVPMEVFDLWLWTTVKTGFNVFHGGPHVQCSRSG